MIEEASQGIRGDTGIVQVPQIRASLVEMIAEDIDLAKVRASPSRDRRAIEEIREDIVTPKRRMRMRAEKTGEIKKNLTLRMKREEIRKRENKGIKISREASLEIRERIQTGEIYSLTQMSEF